MSEPAKIPTSPLGNGLSIAVSGRTLFLGAFPFAEVEAGTQLQDAQRAHRRAFELARDIEVHRLALAGNANLSDAGKADELKSYALSRLKHLRDVQRPMQEARQRLDERRSKLLPVQPREPSDAAGAISDMEIRSFLRSLPDDGRMQAIRADVGLRDAVLRAPAAVAGVSEQAKALLIKAALRDTHADQLGRIEEDELGVAAAERALQVAEGVIRSTAGLGPKDEPRTEEG